MTAAAQTTNETKRLDCLTSLDILDTPPEETFDRITRLVTTLLKVPAATISLVDEDRQWFKSRIGMSVRQTPRSEAFCDHTIQCDCPLIVSDALEDERFAENLLVREHGLRFYAGVPLIVDGGNRVGALCAIDYVPRKLTDEQIGILRNLAATAAQFMELRRTARRLSGARLELTQHHKSLRLMTLTAQHTRSAVIVMDAYGRIEWVNDSFTRITGYAFEAAVGRTPGSLLHGPKTDRDTIAHMLDCMSRGEGCEVEILKYTKSGDELWLAVEIRPVHDESGRLTNFVAIESDVTKRHEAEHVLRRNEQHFRAVIENSPECVKLVARDGTLLEMNAAGLTMIESDSTAHVVGRSVFSVVAPEHRQAFHEFHERVCAGHASRLEYEIIGLKGLRRWMSSHAVPTFDLETGDIQHLAVTTDITERKSAEVELALTRERFEMLSRATQDVVWDLDVETGEVWWNESLQEKFGYDSKEIELSVQWWANLIHPDEREQVVSGLYAAIAADAVHWSDEYQFLHSDGHYVPVLDRAHIIRNPDGRAIRAVGAMLDLTEARRSEHLLHEHNLVIEHSNVVLFRWRPEPGWPVDLVSENVSQFGYSAAELIERKTLYENMVYPRDLQRVTAELNEYIERGVDRFEQEYRIVCRNGDVRWVYDRTVVDRDHVGDLVSLRGVILDIGERKKAEEALRQSEERLYRIASQVPGAVYQFRLDPDGTRSFPYISEGVKELSGLSPEELYADSTLIMSNLVPEDRERIDTSILRSAETMQPWREEFRIRHRDGSVRWISGNSTPTREPDDAIVWHGLITDVTDRKAAEDERRRLTEIVEASTDFVGLADLHGRAIYINRAGRNMLGLGEDEDLNANPVVEYSSSWAVEIILNEGIPAAVRDGHWVGETALLSRDGREIPVSQLIMAHKNFHGEVEYLSTVMRDITLQCQTLAIEADRNRAQAANQAKSEFLAHMSHEIRSPMTAILGSAELLLDPDQSEDERHDAAEMIHRNGLLLLSIISDILDLSRIEAGRVIVERNPSSLVEIITEVSAFARSRAKPKGLRFALGINGLIPETIQTDATRLRQILINLIGNAVKFTDSGHVRLIVELLDPADAPDPRLRFTVADSGIGIASNQIERIFDPFVQADSSTTRPFGGTGLGLAICKRLAEAMGGEMTVESTLGRGSEFTLTIGVGPLGGTNLRSEIPLSCIASEPQEEASSAPAAGGTGLWPVHRRDACATAGRAPAILLVEDSLDNQRVLRASLERSGVEVHTAANGRIACDMVVQSMTQRRPYDLIFMDMQMPEMDGYAATSLIREFGYTGPIVALTAHALATDRDRCLAVGCTEYLSKPVRRAHLVATIERLLAPRASEVQERATADPAAEPEGEFSNVEEPPSGIRDGAGNQSMPDADEVEDAVLKEFREQFVQGLPAEVNSIISSLEEGKLNDLRQIAHRLAGTTGMHRFEEASSVASHVEELVAAGAAVNSIARQVKSLIELIRAVPGYDRLRETRPQPKHSRSRRKRPRGSRIAESETPST